MQSQTPPKGSLEELFRHHLLESEAAAVPPRPLVWDQIDNSLLVHRWGMAASLLLAALAGGGWWHSQQATAPTLASAQPQREAVRRAVAGAVPTPNATNTTPETAALASTTTSTTTSAAAQRYAGAAASGANMAGQTIASQSATSLGGSARGRNSEQIAQQSKESRLALANLTGHSSAETAAGSLAYAAASQGTGRPARQASHATGAAPARTFTFSSPNPDAIAATTTSSSVDFPNALATASRPGLSGEASLPGAAFANSDGAASLADSRLSGEASLSGRVATLAMAPAASLPTTLATKDISIPVPTQLRPWRYGAEYAISAFQPNIDFNRSTSDYNTALGFNTVSLTRAAAAEYRANLRPGLGQRLTLRATRWLGGHWSLSTGVEVAQQEAYSATSAAFTGEQLADISSFAPSLSTSASPNSAYASRDLHESSFRYRSAGVPLELQYDNQAKSGLSFYGRLGAIVSALLSVRSEVASNPEATRTYSFTSSSTPYRRFTALLRGSAGVRYRPAGRSWGLNVGPTAEAGIQSLNTETDRSFLKQSRPYSVGIEAGIEFGGGLKVVQ